MKKLLLLLFSLMLSFNSYGEWTLIHTDDDETVYIDLTTIKKHNEFIYWWTMFDFHEVSKEGGTSGKAYLQGDCGITRLKNLTMLNYNLPMGKGEADTRTFDNLEWSYQPPDSVVGFLLDTSCRMVEASPKEQQEIIEEIQSQLELQKLLEIEEAKVKANVKAKEDLAKELESNLLELEKLVQEQNQQLNELIELRTEYEKDELLLSLVELKKLVEEEEQLFKIAQQLTQVELELKNQLEAEIAAQQQAYESEQYTQLLMQEIQEEKGSELMQNIENQKAILQSAWINNIAAKVKSVWNYPGATPDWFVNVIVTQNKEGKVLNVIFGENNVDNSSQAKAFIRSIERAIYKSSPLPIAPDVSVWDKDIMFIFTP